MNTAAKLLLIFVVASAVILSFTACDRLDDPPLPQTPNGLGAALVSQPSSNEPDPIFLRAEPALP